jgi:tetratricopeptide (TPR) repeat protein
MGMVLLVLGELEEAVAVFQRGVEAADQLGAARVLSRSLLAMALARKDDAARARKVYDEANKLITERTWGWSKIVLQTAYAGVLTAEKRWDEMPDAFEKAEEGLKGAELRLWRVGLLSEWAEAHLQRAWPEDKARARELFAEALEEYQAMGSPGYVERVSTRLSELD